MRRVELLSTARCFEKTGPNSSLLARIGSVIGMSGGGTWVNVGLIRTMCYDHRDVLAVPYQYHSIDGFLLYDEIKKSLDNKKPKIYVSHSRELDFRAGLYEPVRRSLLNLQLDFVLPHEKSDRPFLTKEFLKYCNIVLAEVSFGSIGQGIELGWADALNVPIACIGKVGTKIADSLKTIVRPEHIVGYNDEVNMLEQITKLLTKFDLV